jgi:hypothetical protein
MYDLVGILQSSWQRSAILRRRTAVFFAVQLQAVLKPAWDYDQYPSQESLGYLVSH